MYTQWKAAVDDISDVEGLYPTFALNMAPKSAASVAKTNGIGNTWGLDDDESYICMHLPTKFLANHQTNGHLQGGNCPPAGLRAMMIYA